MMAYIVPSYNYSMLYKYYTVQMKGGGYIASCSHPIHPVNCISLCYSKPLRYVNTSIRPHKVDSQIIVTRPHAILKNSFIIYITGYHKILHKMLVPSYFNIVNVKNICFSSL